MILVYFSDQDDWSSQQGYFKSDKNTREITSMFNAFNKRGNEAFERRTNDDELGTYYYANTPRNSTPEEFMKELGGDFKIVSKNEFFDKCKELNIAVSPTNEKDIREAVKKYLNGNYSIEHIQDEYSHSSLSVRADLFAVSKDKKVITVEIKSDRDTFTRLRKQLEEYAKFSHIVYLAIDIKHLAKFLKNYPNYYGGILVYEDGELELYTACYNKSRIDATKILWKQEWLQFFTYINGSFSKYSITDLENMIRNIFTVEEYYNICEYLFVNRYLKDRLDFKDLIYDLEYKNKLLKIIKEKK